MKKTLLFALTVLLCSIGSAKAQLQQGVKYVGATIKFNGYNENFDYGQNTSGKSNLI